MLFRSPNINQENRGGETPLILAAKRGDAAVIDLLIGAGADLNRTDYTGRTALAWADYQSKRFVSDRLRKAGAK